MAVRAFVVSFFHSSFFTTTLCPTPSTPFSPLLLHQHDIYTMSPHPPHRFDPLIHPDIVDNIIPYLLLIDDNPRFLARAALINKSWNTLYTPFLWRNIKVDNNNFATVSEPLQRYGIYVRHLTVSCLTEAMFDIIAALCPFVEALMFSCPEVSVERLVLYLSTLKTTLRKLSLRMMTVPPEDIVSALVNDTGGGVGEGFSKLKSWSLALDPAVKDTKSLRWDWVVRLMEAHAHVDKLHLINIHVLDPVVTGNHDQDQDHQTAATEEVKDMGFYHALRNPRPLEKQYTTTMITILNFSRLEMDDKRMIDLLGMTPQLTTFCIARNNTVNGDFLMALPILCPKVRKLAVQRCGSIPSSAFSRFFQSLAASSHNNLPQQQQQQDCPSLQLERLLLVRCKLETRSLGYLVSSQASTLLHLHLWKCYGVTDSGLKTVLSRCHRLESLALVENVVLTLAIMTDDNDINNNNKTDHGATFLTTDQEEQQKWACYKTLKSLDIRKFGLQHPEDDFLEVDNSQNRAAFRRIRQRVRMLPALERLTVSVWGADEELLQGFMGVEEEEDQGHQTRQLTIETGNGEGEVGNVNADQTEADATAAVPIPTTDSVASGGVEPPHHHQNQHNNQEARKLVGPRLQSLKVYGQQGKTFIGSDLERFMRNYPGLRELNTSTVVLDKEAVDRLREAGIEALSR